MKVFVAIKVSNNIHCFSSIPVTLVEAVASATLPSSCNKYCDLIGRSEAGGCGKRSEIVDLQLTNQIPDLLYPTIPYNTYNTYITII